MSQCSPSPSRPCACQRCPHPNYTIDDQGWLHLYFPTPHSQAKVLQILNHQSRSLTTQDNLLTVSLDQHELDTLLLTIADVLTPLEQTDVKILFQPHNREMALLDYFEVDSLQRFVAKYRSTWLINLIETNSLYSVFQPIVNAQSPSEIYAFECLLRGAQGEETIPPGKLFGAARDAGLMFQLDVAARFAAIQGAAEHGITSKAFVNFMPSSIYDPANCLRTTMQLFDRLGLSRQQVVFEVVESDQVVDIEHLRNILNFYRNEGFEVALDDLGAGYSSLNMLHELRPDYVKIDVGLTRDVHQDPYKALIAQKLLETAQLLNIRTIAEGIETQGEYEWLRSQGVSFVQGFYFAKPAVPPPAVRADVTAS